MIQEIKGDIFKVSRNKYIAHCVSGDFTLGAGVAKRIDRKYNMRYKLYCTCPYDTVSDSYGYVGEAVLIDTVFNLVIKPTYKSKVRRSDLKQALMNMRTICEAEGISTVYMPRIGAGHEHLVWDKVKAIIEEVFEESTVDIVICIWGR